MAVPDHSRIGCVILAAGNACRFGSNKLAARWDGKALFLRSLEAIPKELVTQTVVVSQYQEVLNAAQDFSFTAIRNEHPDFGISYSIRLGLGALENCDAALFQVSDQPLLRRESVAELIRFSRRHPDKIAALGHGGVRGNPCLFPARFFPELLALEEDHGGSTVIRRHPEALALLEVSALQLFDVDTPEALHQLHQAADQKKQ